MPIEQKGGAVVYTKTPDGLRFAFVHDVFGHWTLSKGSIEEGEDEKECTKREMKEELGLDVKVGEELARNEYVATHPEKGKIRKQVVYFLAEAKHVPLKLRRFRRTRRCQMVQTGRNCRTEFLRRYLPDRDQGTENFDKIIFTDKV